jgi:hypothetical protein
MSEDENKDRSVEQIQAAKQAHEAGLMKKANVVGVGIGFRYKGGQRKDEVVLVVMVRQKVPSNELAAKDLIPAELDGVPVDVQPVGEIRAQ